MFRPQSISSTEARKYFSQIINKVQFSSKSFVVQSYRKPVVRLVKEEYMAILEQVLGKKTVGQIMQISSNDSMREAQKAQEIRKVFQRRLSGGSRPQSQSQPQSPVQVVTDHSVGVERARPAAPKPAPQKVPSEQVSKPSNVVAGLVPAQKPKQQPQPQQKPNKPNNPQKDRGPLLLQNGKNY